MDNLIITTTGLIEGAKVEKYLGVVTANLVVGTNFISDLKASFTDFFGGMSGTYRRQMDMLYQRAYDVLSMKASTLGANCILGFRIDFDELSGKGTQMFMISVSGTAVRIRFLSETLDDNISIASISADMLNVEIFKDKWNSRNKERTPSEEELNYIMTYNLTELAPSLYDYYATKKQPGEQRPIDEKFPIILSTLTYDEAVRVIYHDYPNRSSYAYGLIKSNKLFNGDRILDILNAGNIALAIELLDTEKSYYTFEDIKIMEEIISVVDNLPDKGKIEETKSGVFSSKQEIMYFCPLGHKNHKDVVFCEGNGGTCGLNIKGLDRTEVSNIDAFKHKLTILKRMLK